mmetsp:Transcript_42620/g.83996  ORF Transcript_42620/g.83996 Transcript_42620/m.83996 type:complete len:220 (-) Transcript_42620:1-660(-)
MLTQYICRGQNFYGICYLVTVFNSAFIVFQSRVVLLLSCTNVLFPPLLFDLNIVIIVFIVWQRIEDGLEIRRDLVEARPLVGIFRATLGIKSSQGVRNRLGSHSTSTFSEAPASVLRCRGRHVRGASLSVHLSEACRSSRTSELRLRGLRKGGETLEGGGAGERQTLRTAHELDDLLRRAVDVRQLPSEELVHDHMEAEDVSRRRGRVFVDHFRRHPRQ